MNPKIKHIQNNILAHGYYPVQLACCYAVMKNGKAVANTKRGESATALNDWKELHRKFNQYLATGQVQISVDSSDES